MGGGSLNHRMEAEMKEPNEVTERAIKDSFEHPERGKHWNSVDEMAEWLDGDDEEKQ